jgi:hypothetical protein
MPSLPIRKCAAWTRLTMSRNPVVEEKRTLSDAEKQELAVIYSEAMSRSPY